MNLTQCSTSQVQTIPASHTLICTTTKVLSHQLPLYQVVSEVRAVCNQQPCPVRALWLAHTCTLVSGAGGMWSKHNKSLSRRLNMQEEGLRLHKHKHSANEGLAPIAPLPAGKRIPVPFCPWNTFIKLRLRIMEAHFRHWIKKGYCDFLSHNSDFFSIASYKVRIMIYKVTIAR